MAGCLVFPGLVLVFFGVLLLLENLGVAENLVGRYWPVVLIVVGLASMFNMNGLRVRISRLRNRFRDRF